MEGIAVATLEAIELWIIFLLNVFFWNYHIPGIPSTPETESTAEAQGSCPVPEGPKFKPSTETEQRKQPLRRFVSCVRYGFGRTTGKDTNHEMLRLRACPVATQET